MCGCSAEKSQRDFFDGLSTPVFEPGRIFAVSLSVLVLILAVLTVLVLTVLLILLISVLILVLVVLIILVGHDFSSCGALLRKYPACRRIDILLRRREIIQESCANNISGALDFLRLM